MNQVEAAKAVSERAERICKAKVSEMSDLDQRHFDIVHKAVNEEELDFVVENTKNRDIQDYAIAKRRFFSEKEKSR